MSKAIAIITGSPSNRQATPPVQAPPVDPAAQQRKQDDAMRAAATQKTTGSSVLTSALGVQNDPNVARKTLLGA